MNLFDLDALSRIGLRCAWLLVFSIGAGAASAQGLVGMEKQVLPMTAASWVAFRNYDGRQLIYFTHLVVYRCGLAEIRYSINGDGLGEQFAMPPCDPAQPNAIPADHLPYIALPLATAETVSVQVVYKDGEESEVLTFRPCDTAGDGTCAELVE